MKIPSREASLYVGVMTEWCASVISVSIYWMMNRLEWMISLHPILSWKGCIILGKVSIVLSMESVHLTLMTWRKGLATRSSDNYV